MGALLRGGGLWVLAGRGMGKTVFLRQLEQALLDIPELETRVVRIPTAPANLSFSSCLKQLANRLDIDTPVDDTGELVVRFQEKHGTATRLIILLDEFDRYCRMPLDHPGSLAGRDFFNDLENTRKDHRVGVLAAGGIGSFVFRDVLGSSFLSRAQRVLLEVFGREQVEDLAHPFMETREPLSDEILDLLMLATGGNPALVTYGLQSLWEIDRPNLLDVARAFDIFGQDHRQYLETVRRSFADPQLSGAPQRVWTLVRESKGKVPLKALREACRGENLLRLDFADAIDLLRASGLVRLDGSYKADPVSLYPMSSILNLEVEPSVGSTLGERFREDLQSILERLHRSSADFFRPGIDGKDKSLVPEATFSGLLAIAFEGAGWHVQRETQSAAGRTDLILEHPTQPGEAIIEVKIWGRNDYEDVHAQVEGYWSSQTTVGAVVMLTERALADWSQTYKESCLNKAGYEFTAVPTAGTSVSGHWSCTSKTIDGLEAQVDHFLLRIARR